MQHGTGSGTFQNFSVGFANGNELFVSNSWITPSAPEENLMPVQLSVPRELQECDDGIYGSSV